jgi:hypothetical protein
MPIVSGSKRQSPCVCSACYVRSSGIGLLRSEAYCDVVEFVPGMTYGWKYMRIDHTEVDSSIVTS